MNSVIAAVPGQWYLDAESREMFRIVGLDEQDRCIDIQYADGSLGECAWNDWMARRLELCEQPD